MLTVYGVSVRLCGVSGEYGRQHDYDFVVLPPRMRTTTACTASLRDRGSCLQSGCVSLAVLRSCSLQGRSPASVRVTLRRAARHLSRCLAALICVCAISVHATQPNIGRVRVSPDGDRILAIATDGTESVLAVSDLATGTRTVALRSGKGQSLDACNWISGDRVVCTMFVFRGRAAASYDRRRVIRLVAVDHDGGHPVPLLDRPPARPPRLGGGTRGAGIALEDLEHALVGRVPSAPDHALVSSSREASPYTTVFQIDTRSGAFERVVHWQQGILFWHADWDGDVLVGNGHYSFGPRLDEPWLGPTAVVRNGAEDWRRIDVSQLATPVGPRQMAGPRILGFSRDAADVYYEAAADGGRVALWAAESSTLEPTRPIKSDPERDVRAMVIGGRACGIVGFAHALPNTPLTWLDRDFGKAVGAAADKHGLGTIVAVPSMSDDCRRIILTSSDQRTYLRFHLLDLETDTVRHLGGHDVGVANRSSTERHMVRYRTREGLALPMALTLPTTVAGPPPVIVLLDDGANEDVESLDTWPHYFAQRGYAVAQPAIRGYRGYGAEFQLAGLRMRGRRLQEDVADALAWLAGEGVVDGERACIAGRGRGAHFALAAVVTRSDGEQGLPRCAAAYAVLDARRPSVGTTNRWTRASAAGSLAATGRIGQRPRKCAASCAQFAVMSRIGCLKKTRCTGRRWPSRSIRAFRSWSRRKGRRLSMRKPVFASGPMSRRWAFSRKSRQAGVTSKPSFSTKRAVCSTGYCSVQRTTLDDLPSGRRVPLNSLSRPSKRRLRPAMRRGVHTS